MIYIVISYLVGSIPFGLLFGRLAGIDVREDGSGNIGATNVNRLLGKKLGLATLLCDAAKGYLPMLGAAFLGAGREIILLCGLAAFIGHIFPLYLKFKGGKGVATALGVFLFLSPKASAISAAVFIALVAAIGFVSLGSMAAALSMPPALFLTHAPINEIWLALVVAVIIVIRHHQNIGRLLKGEEKSWRKKAKG